MPRPVCDVYTCGERPILAVHWDVAGRHYGGGLLTNAGHNRTILRRHVRLCSIHAARCGIVQLVVPTLEGVTPHGPDQAQPPIRRRRRRPDPPRRTEAEPSRLC